MDCINPNAVDRDDSEHSLMRKMRTDPSNLCDNRISMEKNVAFLNDWCIDPAFEKKVLKVAKAAGGDAKVMLDLA